jgi:hypothetical protein
MLPLEIAIIKAWLIQHEKEYDRFEYNVRIGSGTDPGPSYDPTMRKMALDITKKRVDAVAWQGSAPTLIEVKNRATLAAVGQILSYNVLWKQDYPTGPDPKLLLIAATFDPDTIPVLNAHNVTWTAIPVNPLFIPRRMFPRS